MGDALVQPRTQIIEPKIEIRKSKPQQNKNITKSVLTVIDILTQEPELTQKSASKLTTTPISSLKSTPTTKTNSIDNLDSIQLEPKKQICNVKNLDFKNLEQPRLTRQIVYKT